MSSFLFNGNNSIWNVSNESDIEKAIRSKLKILEPCNITPEERIGSDSTMGEVYKWDGMAVKVIPILNKSSFNNNLKEIELAKEVSDLVINVISPYFPIVYGCELCDDTRFYKHSESTFSKQSRTFQKTEEIQSHLLFSDPDFEKWESSYK